MQVRGGREAADWPYLTQLNLLEGCFCWNNNSLGIPRKLLFARRVDVDTAVEQQLHQRDKASARGTNKLVVLVVN